MGGDGVRRNVSDCRVCPDQCGRRADVSLVHDGNLFQMFSQDTCPREVFVATGV